eukprot:Sdes_comp16159_c0_seq1m5405
MSESESERSDEMDETPSPTKKLQSAVVVRSKKFYSDDEEEAVEEGEEESEEKHKNFYEPQKSIEGWIIFVTGIHEEAQEDDVYEHFAEFGDVNNLQLVLDRRTGYVKGYAFVEYSDFDSAQDAIQKRNGQQLLGQTLTIDWACIQGKPSEKRN